MDFNLVFLGGPIGVGKTHLVQAMASVLKAKTPSLKVVRLSGDEFTNEFVRSIRRNEREKFYFEYCESPDILILDGA